MTDGTPSEKNAFGPSFDEIIAHFAPMDETTLSWIDDYRESWAKSSRACDVPLGLKSLLRFAYEIGTPTGEEDEPFEELEDFVADAHEWGLAQWVERARDRLPVEERTLAAVTLQSTWWLPVLRPIDPAMAEQLERLLDAAAECVRNPSASRAPLEAALSTRTGLPPSRPPPPYVGHFSGAVTRLLHGLTVPKESSKAFAKCLSYSVVAPGPPSRLAEIAALVEGVEG